MSRPIKDRVGQECGWLRVQGLHDSGGPRGTRWLAVCARDLGGCGGSKVVTGVALSSGRAVSCGCRARQRRGAAAIARNVRERARMTSAALAVRVYRALVDAGGNGRWDNELARDLGAPLPALAFALRAVRAAGLALDTYHPSRGASHYALRAEATTKGRAA